MLDAQLAGSGAAADFWQVVLQPENIALLTILGAILTIVEKVLEIWSRSQGAIKHLLPLAAAAPQYLGYAVIMLLILYLLGLAEISVKLGMGDGGPAYKGRRIERAHMVQNGMERSDRDEIARLIRIHCKPGH
jgi:hypothetical protein